MIKIMMTAAFALAATTAPAIAQTGQMSGQSTGSGSMASGDMQSGSTNSGMNGSMTSGTKMSKTQMAAMKRCQSSAKAMKTKSCMKMQKMHPEMSSGM